MSRASVPLWIRSETRAFRIDADAGEKLEALAERERTSINPIADQALRRRVEYEVLAEGFGHHSDFEELLGPFFNMASEEQARSLFARLNQTFLSHLAPSAFRRSVTHPLRNNNGPDELLHRNAF